MTLFAHKYERVQEKFEQNLGKVEASMAALREVALHPALRSEGRESLADVVPCDRILRFTGSLQAERERLSQRLGKLRQLDASAQTLCDQAAEKFRRLLQDDAVLKAAGDIRGEMARVEGELLPALRAIVPSEGASPAAVLEEEKRSAGVLEGLVRVCAGIRDMLSELQACWSRQHGRFLQRLREVAYIQSKVRGVERQAALLEEEINVQHNYSQQLNHLQKMPKAYQRALTEVARRRQFRARYLAQAEQARSSLARMMEEENSRRRAFTSRRRPSFSLGAPLLRNAAEGGGFDEKGGVGSWEGCVVVIPFFEVLQLDVLAKFRRNSGEIPVRFCNSGDIFR